MNDARRELALAVRSAPAAPETYRRVEIEVGPADPLAWLAAQPMEDKGYWSDRGGEVEIAAAGEADTVKAAHGEPRAEAFAHMRRRLADAPDAMRYYGGFRFSGDTTPDLAWRPFGDGRFLLPRFEMSRTGSSTRLACHFLPSERTAALREIERLSDPPRAAEWKLPRRISSRHEPGAADWAASVRRALDAMRAGQLEKIVLARRTVMDFLGLVDPLAVMARLRRDMPSCFHFCGSHRGLVAFAGASPERLYRRIGRVIETEALAGTRPRGENPEVDRERGEDLLRSGKEAVEHRVVVESILESLRPLARELSAASPPALLRLPNVQHLRTPISGQLDADVSDADILARLHPTPAVGGRPRAKALARIRDWEPFDRGWYCGPVGWVGRDAAEFAVAIRCGLAMGPRLNLYAGAGIVPGSEPDEEWKELDGKLRAFLDMLPSE